MDSLQTHVTPAERFGLPDTVELVQRAFRQYQVKWKRLVGLIVLSWVAFMVLFGVAGVLFALMFAGTVSAIDAGSVTGAVVMGLILLLAVIVAGAIITAVQSVALIDVVLEEKPRPFWDLIRDGVKKWKPALWVIVLTGLLVAGGYFLLVIPGIVLAVFTSYVLFLFVEGKGKGMQTVLQSHGLVRGRWWAVFGRSLLVTLIGMIAMFLVSFVGEWISRFIDNIAAAMIIQTLANNVFSLFVFSPIIMLFSGELYKELKKHPNVLKDEEKPRIKNWYVGVAIAGYVFFAVFMAVPLYKLLTAPTMIGTY